MMAKIYERVALIGLGLIGYALIADLPAPQSEVKRNVPLHTTN